MSRCLCALVSSYCLQSLSPGLFVLSAVSEGLCALPKFVYLPSIGTPVPPFRQQFVTRGYLGLPSVLQGLCMLAGFVCMLPNSRFPELAVCLRPQSRSS